MLENAVRYAWRQVRFQTQAGPKWAGVNIEGDGLGVADAQARDALVRGGRLDEATGGTITISRSTLGGLKVAFCGSRALAQ